MNPNSKTTLTASEAELLERIKAQMGIVADISRADILLYGPLSSTGKTTVLAHAHPHSVAPAYRKIYTDAVVGALDMPVVYRALKKRRKQHGSEGIFSEGFSVLIVARPIRSPENPRRVIGVLSVDSSLLEHERQRRRLRPFQVALVQLQDMLAQGLVNGAEELTPFEGYSGLMVVNRYGVIRYTSGVAANLYRRLGYLDSLVNRQLNTLDTHDFQLFLQAMRTQRCVEVETEDGGRQWVRKVIPLVAKPSIFSHPIRLIAPRRVSSEPVGVLMVIRDQTAERRQEQEMRVKNAMIQEIHHRVKNNLQTIAALLRIQSRRLKSEEAKDALRDAINRVQSVAVIHEFLSDENTWAINIKEAFQRIVAQTKQGIVSPEDNISFRVEGPPIWLPARQATACALVINEMVQNSLEHGFENQRAGTVTITLQDEGDHVIITIRDDGQGLPDDFDPNRLPSLGLQIAHTLVTEDLRGELTFAGSDGGFSATITFPKGLFGGEEGWVG